MAISHSLSIGCARLVEMPAGHHAVYVADMRLRARKGGAPEVVNAAHFLLYPVAGGYTPAALSAAILESCIPCDMRAAAEFGASCDGSDDGDGDMPPCWPEDLAGVDDGSVRTLYRVSQNYYFRAHVALRVALNCA